MLILATIIIWVICGILAYGLTFAYFQREFSVSSGVDYFIYCGVATYMGILGPIGLIIHLTLGNCKHGFKWK